MKRRAALRSLFPAGLGAGLLSLALGAWGAVPVEESVPGTRGGAQGAASPQQGAAGGAEPGRLAELFYEMQLLKQEVQELRGTMEEQQHRLDRLARDQQEQYLDLDRRMQTLRDGGGGGASSGGAGGGGQEDGGGVGGPSGPAFDGGGAGAPRSEREAYTAAFELMKQRRFEASTEAFEQLVADYPNGAYTPNAFYWLGELHLAQERNEQARQYFAQVVNLYPDHQKVPDALYKLGVVYHRLGDLERARNYLQRVSQEYAQSSAAGLAQTYLSEL